MKVRDIDTILIDSPGRKWTIVRVHTDEGITGLGEATYSLKETIVAAAIEDLKRYVIGEDPSRIEYLWSKLSRTAHSGIWRMAGPVLTSAISGIDQALWDLKGRVLGAPLVELLGGRYRDRVRLYTHFGGRSAEDWVRGATRLVEMGFDAIKTGPVVRGGDHDIYADEGRPELTGEYLAAVREAVGPDVELLIDAHGRFTVSAALRMARAMEPSRPYVFEEPVPPDDFGAYVQVRRGTTVPIMGSERLTTKTQFRQFLEAGALDVAQPDLVYAGGITECRKIAAIADTYHVPISFHNTKGPIGILAAAHVMASIPNAAPCEFISNIPWRDEIITHPLQVEKGHIILSDRPGLGVDLNMDGIEKHRWRG
jgi:galactonate dehydratase